MIEIRDVATADLDAVLALNNAAGPGIVPIDMARLRHIERQAAYFRVACIDGQMAGFLIGMTPGADYDSPNYQWFSTHFRDEGFVYLDRVVVGATWRRHGVGRVLYADIVSFAEIRMPWLTTEVFIEPRDDVALVFFDTQAFREVGQLELPGGRRVSLLAKRMKAFQYVYDHYLSRQPNPAPAAWWTDRLHPPALKRIA